MDSCARKLYKSVFAQGEMVKDVSRVKAQHYLDLARRSTEGSYQQAELYEEAGELFRGIHAFDEASASYEKAQELYRSCKDKGHKSACQRKVIDLNTTLKKLSNERTHTRFPPKEGGLVGKVSIVAICTGFFLALFLFMQSITGYAVSNLSTNSSTIGGVIFLLLALTGLVVYTRNRGL